MSGSKFVLLVAAGLAIMSAGQAYAQFQSYEGSEQGKIIASVGTDGARYAPGDTVEFSVTLSSTPGNSIIYVRYSHLDETVTQDSLTVDSSGQMNWVWVAPADDFQGYMVDLFLFQNGILLDHASIGVDVSSSWARFPRYGFLSSYPYMTQAEMDSIVGVLNRYHINGIQFYDWQYKHNMPLKGTPQSPAPTWNDIANRTNFFPTVMGYIQSAHKYGMAAMSYNLLYGAYADADQDGVNVQWSLYKDANHQTREVLQLPSGWASSIYLMDPSNEQWRSYLFSQEKNAFEVFPFDGWHIDQLGDWGTMYNYAGQPIVVSNAFTSFIQEAKSYLNKEMVMNAVNQYGQTNIAQAPVDFLYTEVWDPSVNYADLVSIINRNSSYCNGRLNTVLAAYMDYDLANSTGWFNTPGVLMADAVIFAAGGDHLELGEHMLCKEYFPNANLQMTDSLRQALVHYYDFLTAYENVLRDSLQTMPVTLSTSSPVSISPVQSLGTVWYFSEYRGNRQVVQLLNYVDARNLLWRDKDGTQTEPDTITNLQLSIPTNQSVKKIWLASPDFDGGSPDDISFSQDTNVVSFTVPRLKYWDMLVIEYDSTLTSLLGSRYSKPAGFALEQNYPNPFNPTTAISYRLSAVSHVVLKVYDALGRKVATLADGTETAGTHSVEFDGTGLASGVYLFSLATDRFVDTKKMLLLK